MKRALRAFTLIEILVALTMISFLMVTGLGMSYRYLSSFRFWTFQNTLEEHLDATEQLALADVSFSSSDSEDFRWHLYGRIIDGEILLFRFESSAHPDVSEQRVVEFYDALAIDHFPLQASGFFLTQEDFIGSGPAFLMHWGGAVKKWSFEIVDDSFSLSEGFEFSFGKLESCSPPTSCELQFDLQEAGGVAYHFLISAFAELSRERFFSS